MHPFQSVPDQGDGQTRKEASTKMSGSPSPPTTQLAELAEASWDTDCPWWVQLSLLHSQIWERAKSLDAEGQTLIVPGPSGGLMVNAALFH